MENVLDKNFNFLVWKTQQGWTKRNLPVTKEYLDRRDFELSVIKEMNFCDYFLIIADIVNWAKDNSIPVGPGRGSGVGSITCYALGITTIDPIKFGLYFERFLNPSRISMPDIDLDFCTERRSEVVKYIENRYGTDHVANIITFNCMQARASVKEAARALKINNYVTESDKMAKLIPMTSESIAECIKTSPLLEQYAVQYPEVFSAADAFMGKPKSAGVHAAGVVISPKKLVEYFPLYTSSKAKHLESYASITQWDMYDMDELGFLKIDILGLNTLTIIDRTVKSIKKRHNIDVVLEDIDLEDPKTLDLFAKGNTTGLFQLERKYVQDFCRRMDIKNFMDVVCMNAIIRPGTMDAGMTTEFIDRRSGKKDVEYIHPEFKDLLSATQGILIFQEHAMKMVQIYAGFTLAEADGLRKAIGKKIPEKMAEAKKLFMKLAVDNKKRDPVEAEQIFSYVETFSRYGFNLSHAVAYAKITFQAGYLKAYFPLEYMCELLNGEMSSSPGDSKIEMYIEEARYMNIKVNPPSLRDGSVLFRINKDGEIDFGVGFIKHVGIQGAEGALKSKGEFSRFTDFLEKVSMRTVNERTVRMMIYGGAFDFLGMTRNLLYEKYSKVKELVHKCRDQQKRKAGGVKLRSEMNMDEVRVVEDAIVAPENPLTMEQLLNEEHECLCAFVSQSPTAPFEHIIRDKTNADIFDLMQGDVQGENLCIAGRINEMRVHIVKKGDNIGKEMAFVNLSYHNCDIDALVFTSAYAKLKTSLVIGKICLFTGKSERRAFFSITDIETLSQI
jgi:DNA polymerase-3 subunit alpha